MEDIPCVVISLDEDPDAIRRLEAEGLRPMLYHAQRHELGGRIGCIDSHINGVYREALKKDLPAVAVFEDDVTFRDHVNVDAFTEAMERYAPDVYMFGVRGPLTVPTSISNVSRLVGVCQGSHAYVASREFMQAVVSAFDDVDGDWDAFFTDSPREPSFVDIFRRFAQKPMGQYPFVAKQLCDHESTVSPDHRKNIESVCTFEEDAWYNLGQYVLHAPVLACIVLTLCLLICMPFFR